MKSRNCPNCGAPITSYICEYCDTVLDSEAYLAEKRRLQELKDQQQRIEKDLRDAQLRMALQSQTQMIQQSYGTYSSPFQSLQANQADLLQLQLLNCIANTRDQLTNGLSNVCCTYPNHY